MNGELSPSQLPTLAALSKSHVRWSIPLTAHVTVCSPSYYPNYLAFFHRLIATPPHHHSPYAGCASSVVPVLERFLLDGESQMLVRAVSGAIHSLIHIGHGVEFGVDALVAEGAYFLWRYSPASLS